MTKIARGDSQPSVPLLALFLIDKNLIKGIDGWIILLFQNIGNIYVLSRVDCCYGL